MIANKGAIVTPFIFPFSFSEVSTQPVKGWVELEKPLPYTISEGSGYYRQGKLSVEGGGHLDLVLYHNLATRNFIYLRESPPDFNLLDLIGIRAGRSRPSFKIGFTRAVMYGLGAVASHRPGHSLCDWGAGFMPGLDLLPTAQSGGLSHRPGRFEVPGDRSNP